MSVSGGAGGNGASLREVRRSNSARSSAVDSIAGTMVCSG
jgi:hypothetical protein